MKLAVGIFSGLIFSLLYISPVFAAVSTSSDITNYTKDTLQIITLIGTALAVFFLIKAGYQYITSSGNPENITEAKKTIRNALIGLIIILSAGVIVSTFKNSLQNPSSSNSAGAVSLMAMKKWS